MAAIDRMRGGNAAVQEALKKRQQPRRPNRRGGSRNRDNGADAQKPQPSNEQ